MNALLLTGGLLAACGLVSFLLGVTEARALLVTPRPLPRTDHDCDVMAGALDEQERLIGLYVAGRELRAAAARMEAADA